jgi:hypothetical protein
VQNGKEIDRHSFALQKEKVDAIKRNMVELPLCIKGIVLHADGSRTNIDVNSCLLRFWKYDQRSMIMINY